MRLKTSRSNAAREEFPEWSDGTHIHPADDPRSWFAVYTKSRHEKKVNWSLGEKNVETFLPLKETLVRWKDRVKRIFVPLFPGYLFVRIDPFDRLGVLTTKGVVCILGSKGEPVPVPLCEIEATKKLLGSGLKFKPFPFEFEGKEVVITNGPLEGAKGRVLHTKGVCNLILSVNLIRRSVSVEIDVNDVEFV